MKLEKLYEEEMSVRDLNVDSPEKAIEILEQVIDDYRESEMELAHSWQDKYAGAVWGDFARILERAVAQMKKATNERFRR